MTRAFLPLALVVAGIGSVTMPATAPAIMADKDKAVPVATDGSTRPRCLPIVQDYHWLDHVRMGMNGSGSDRNANADSARRDSRQQNRNRTWSRRMRMVHLRHGGFPERVTGGCPTCQPRDSRRRLGKPGLAVQPEQGSRRRWQRGAGNRHRMDPDLARAVIWLETPDNLIHRIDPGRPGRLRFNARLWGQYRVFAYVDQGARNGVRQLHFAFLDLFSHGDDVSRRERPKIEGNGYENGRPVFFLERLYANDRQRYRTQTGEEARFRLTLRGKPVKGACVVMITQKGWRKAKRTDARGEVSFFLIKETPTESGWRARRRSEKYLVVAQHFEPAAEGAGPGIRGTRYVASQLLRVRPSRLEWESRGTAFLLASFTAVAAGAAIAIRRVRRRCRRERNQ